ncbi:MAG TPA: fluoride efflux transporter CrcB [Bryobacteraceae bacterium]|jgi:CrcB protein|nr:fluoride efflux transporter CrcB [Bryobacteraceae bacterium]
MLKSLLAVMLGGSIGSGLRFLASVGVSRLYSGPFPLGTFLVNISGSFVVGLLMAFFVLRSEVSPAWRLFLVTGVLGGYTTFSSFEWETFALLDRGAPLIALLNILLSVILGFGGVMLGAFLTGRLRGESY